MLTPFAEAMASNEEVQTNPAQSPTEADGQNVKDTVVVSPELDPSDLDRSPWPLLGLPARPMEQLGYCIKLFFLKFFCFHMFAPSHMT